MRKLTGLSLFTGAGGMDIGFKNAGIRTLVASEINKNAADTYEINNPDVKMFRGDINDNILEIIEASRGVDVVFGGPPCQGFSVAGKMNPDDPRSQLIWTYLEVVERVNPSIFVMENVKALGTLSKWELVRKKFIDLANDMGYHCEYFVLNASDYGVPQNRERVFFVGSKNKFNRDDFEIYLQKNKEKPQSLRELFRSIPKIGTGENPITCTAKISLASNPVLRKSPYAGMIFNGMGRPLDLLGYSYTLPASMGGNKTPIVDERMIWDEDAPSWLHEYHNNLLQGGSVGGSVPDTLRRISLREAAAIQTFPESYVFCGQKSSVYTQIGNAVPCKLAEKVARAAVEVALRGEKYQNPAFAFGRLI